MKLGPLSEPTPLTTPSLVFASSTLLVLPLKPPSLTAVAPVSTSVTPSNRSSLFGGHPATATSSGSVFNSPTRLNLSSSPLYIFAPTPPPLQPSSTPSSPTSPTPSPSAPFCSGATSTPGSQPPTPPWTSLLPHPIISLSTLTSLTASPRPHGPLRATPAIKSTGPVPEASVSSPSVNPRPCCY